MSAKYIFRLDDATAFLNIDKWNKIEAIFKEFNIKPIVAVTPDNKDPGLKYSDEDIHFWEKVNNWKDIGWDIAMHGYQHLYHEVERKKLIIPYYDRSEFAGLSLEEQKDKIRKSLKIFNANNIDPKIWVAPSHSFDKLTLKALKVESNIKIVSDGISLYPYYKNDFYFLPQQLWDVKKKYKGIWTICLHPDTMTDEQIKAFEKEISFEEIHNNIISMKDIRLEKNRYICINFIYKVYFWSKYNIFNFLRPIKNKISNFLKS